MKTVNAIDLLIMKTNCFCKIIKVADFSEKISYIFTVSKVVWFKNLENLTKKSFINFKQAKLDFLSIYFSLLYNLLIKANKKWVWNILLILWSFLGSEDFNCLHFIFNWERTKVPFSPPHERPEKSNKTKLYFSNDRVIALFDKMPQIISDTIECDWMP